MTTETTPSATVPAVAPTAANAPASIKETVLAQFKEAEATISTLAAKYANVAYAVGTPKGMKDAKDARADLRDNGRLFVTKAEERIKGEVNDLKRLMASEVLRLVAIVKPVEDSIDAQIKAEETRKANEKAKRDREEADRIAEHRGNIAKFKDYVTNAEDKPLESIQRGIEVLSAITFGPEWEEFAAEAAAACQATITSLHKLADSERQRLENERLQKELADARAALAAATTEPAAAQVPAVQTPSPEFIDLLPDDEFIAPAVPPTATITHEAAVSVMPATVRRAMAPAPAPATTPTMTLGEISTKLGFNVTSVFLASLGFEATTVKAAKLFHEEEFPAIGRKLIEHIEKVCELQAEPA